MDRRAFLKSSSVMLGGLAAAKAAEVGAGEASEQPSVAAASLPEDWRKIRKVCVHMHLSGGPRPYADPQFNERAIEAADSLGIDRFWTSIPITHGLRVEATVERVREANDAVLELMKRYQPRVQGTCFINPGLGQAALDEIDRCIDAGMISIKLYNQHRYTEPVVFPVAEKAIERGVPLLGHSAYLFHDEMIARQPNTSNGRDFCELAGRYPELMLIMGHINGGGDWEWSIKAIRNCSNVYLDTSGSGQDDLVIDTAVRELGHKRIVFGTDTTMEPAVGRIFAADLTPQQREDIFWRNAEGLLKRRKS